MLVPPLKCVFALIQFLELIPQCVLERIISLRAMQLNRRGKYRERLLQLNPACPNPLQHPLHTMLPLTGLSCREQRNEWPQQEGLQAVCLCLMLFSAAEKAFLNTLSFMLPLPCQDLLCWFGSLSSCWEGLYMSPGNRGAVDAPATSAAGTGGSHCRDRGSQSYPYH